MPRDQIRELFEQQIKSRSKEVYGQTVTRFKLTPYDPLGTVVPIADIQVSGHIISGIPLAANNRELTYIMPGTSVKMSRSITGRLEVTGLSQRGPTSTYMYTYSLPQLTPQVSAGAISAGGQASALVAGSLTSMGSVGFVTRTLTFEDLITASGGGFGLTPLGATALLDLDGNIVGYVT